MLRIIIIILVAITNGSCSWFSTWSNTINNQLNNFFLICFCKTQRGNGYPCKWAYFHSDDDLIWSDVIWYDLEYNSDLFQTKLSVQEGQSRWSSVWGDGPLLPPGLILYLYCVAYTCLYLCLYPYNLYLCNLSLSQCVLVLLLVLLFVRLALYCTTSRSCTSLYTVHLAWR